MSRSTARAPIRSPRRTPNQCIAAAAIVLLAAAGCDRPSAAGSSGDAPAPLRQVASLGDPAHPDARITIAADRSALSVADRLVLTVRIESRTGFRAEWASPLPQPPTGQLGDFTVAAHTRSTPSATPGVTEDLFVLEPFLDGPKSIPALTFRVVSTWPSSAGDSGTTTRPLSTEPITINVAALLTPEEAAKAELSPPLPPVEARLPSQPARAPIGALIGGGAALAVGLGVLAWRVARRRPAAVDPARAAVSALADVRATLEAAAADPFGPAAARVGSAASQIGSIVRAFLERGLSIAAIGATTPELRARLAASLPEESSRPLEQMLTDLEREAFSPGQPRVAPLLEQLAAAERFIREATTGPAGSTGVEGRR